MKKEDLDLNIFMMCDTLNKDALTHLPAGFHIRNCRPDEIDIWKGFPFDSDIQKRKYHKNMSDYFNNVYGNRENEFFKRCLFVCENKTNRPIATCFVWKAYNKINTIHWFKTLKEYEGNGIGRALLSYIMASLKKSDYPLFLHTQLGSFKAIGLYSSFGFKIVTNDTIGYRQNDYKKCLPLLEKMMRKNIYNNLKFIEAPSIFNECAKSSKIAQF